MGAWGYYDDENDNACDEWCEVLSMWESNKNMSIYQCIEQWMKTLDGEDMEDDSYVLVGVCLKAIKDSQGDINADPLSTGLIFCITDHHLPKKLPDDFPPTLKKDCLNAINYMIQNVDQNERGWCNLQYRKKSLQEELEYFTHI